MSRALNGATVKVTMDLAQTKESQGASNVTSWLTAMALLLAGRYAVHRFMIPIRLTHCVMLQTESGNGLKRFLLTGGYRGDIARRINRGR